MVRRVGAQLCPPLFSPPRQMKEPRRGVSCPTRLFPHRSRTIRDLGGLGGWSANGRQFNTDTSAKFPTLPTKSDVCADSFAPMRATRQSRVGV